MKKIENALHAEAFENYSKETKFLESRIANLELARNNL
jgi:hypothetical protein